MRYYTAFCPIVTWSESPNVAIHNREYLSCVMPDGLFLVLDLMHFAQEVIEPEGLNVVTGVDLAPKEIQMAQMLVVLMLAASTASVWQWVFKPGMG
jgi:hypothetical protein